MNQDRKRPVTLEDLLRLKRAERPPAEFWGRFDRELRTKQLAALVEKHSWWDRFAASFGLLAARYRVPVGATAILGLSFVTINEYRSNPQPIATDSVATASIASAPTSTLRIETAMPVLADAAVLPEYHVREAVTPVRIEEAVEVPATSTSSRLQLVSLLTNFSDPVSSDLMAANLAATQAAEPSVARGLLGASSGFDSRILPVRAPAVEPLAQMPTPGQARRAQFQQAAMAMMRSVDMPTRIGSTRVQISDERILEQPTRLKGRPEGISVFSF
jgi:hypothetical protein